MALVMSPVNCERPSLILTFFSSIQYRAIQVKAQNTCKMSLPSYPLKLKIEYRNKQMAIEIEKKYRIDKKIIVELTTKLSEVGAAFAYEVFEENYLHRGGLLDGRSATLRLRRTDFRTTLTYKEKVPNESEFKQQIEFETDVSNVDATESIIEKLGYKLSVIYEKHRKAWKFNNVEVVLDELPFGYYMEIEGEMDDILEVEKTLGADKFEIEPRGYPRLSAKYGKANEAGVTEARFAKTTGA